MGERLFKGADYHAKKDRWRGVIEFKKKVYRSPYFMTQKEAQDWYDAKSYELYGYDRVHKPEIDAMEVDNLADSLANTESTERSES